MYIKTPQSLFILMFSFEKNDQKRENNFVHNIITNDNEYSKGRHKLKNVFSGRTTKRGRGGLKPT